MKKIFISYSYSTDKALVTGLKHALLSEGIKVVDPSEELLFGEDIASHILSLIRGSDAIIAIIGHDRPNVLLEIGYAMGAGKNVLLMAESERSIPSDLQALPYVYASGPQKSTISQVLRQVTSLTDIPTQPSGSYVTTEEQLSTIYTNPEYFQSMDWRTFEKLVAERLHEIGFTVEIAKTKIDTGFDFIITTPDDKNRIIVEAKKFTKQSKVSLNHVRSLLGVASVSGATSAMLISSSGFTASALALAAVGAPKLILIGIEQLLQSHNTKELLESSQVKNGHVA